LPGIACWRVGGKGGLTKQKRAKMYNFVDAKSPTGSSQEFYTLDAE
jgi:hypothetical protein